MTVDTQPHQWSAFLGRPSGAHISPCGKYRTLLWRTFAIGGDAAPLVFVMLNPSTADEHVDDPTITRCLGFAHRFGAGGIAVVNLCAYRTKSPRVLLDAYRRGVDVIGEGCDDGIGIVQDRGTVVCAWGAWGSQTDWLARRRLEVAMRLRYRNPRCLGHTRKGEPRHPLMLPRNARLVGLGDCAECGVPRRSHTPENGCPWLEPAVSL